MSLCQEDGVTGSTECSWRRRLKLTCSSDKDKNVYIRVQSNALPDHCFIREPSPAMFPIENYIDFKVLFDTDPTLIGTTTVPATSMCGMGWPNKNNLLSSSVLKFTEYSGVNEQIVGIALNGVPILNALDSYNLYDAI